jgi:hypothetical protein
MREVHHQLSMIKSWFIGFTALMIGLAIIGAFRAYSPIPMGDSWDGNFAIYLKTINGDWSAWWAQHNEHRIVLSKIIFWINNRYLGGSNAFLIAINFACITASVYLFWKILREVIGAKKFTNIEICCGLAITSWLFLWCQQENFLWEFQNQFILAQLLPLGALFWLYRSEKSKRDFLIACIFGTASAVSMANGILALPLMTVYAALTKQPLKRIVTLAILSICILAAYLHDYKSPTHHSTLIQALEQQPFKLIQYFLYYLGSPFRYLFHIKFLALTAGIIMVGVTIFTGIRALLQKNNLLLCLALFNSYIMASALGTASGRVIFGVDQAFASRYTTPSLMAWAVLFLAFLPSFLPEFNKLKFDRNHKKNIVFLAISALLMLGVQLKTLGSHTQSLWMRKVSGLALAIQVNDEKQILEIAGPSEATLAIAKPAADLHIGFFGDYPFKDLSSLINAYTSPKPDANCSVKINAIKFLPSDTKFLRIEGEILNSKKQAIPDRLTIVDHNHQIIGFALTRKMPSFSSSENNFMSDHEFIGYFLNRDNNQAINIETNDGICQLTTPFKTNTSN